MKRLKCIIISLLIILFIQFSPVMADYAPDRIYYGVAGNSSKIKTLNLNTEHLIDPINTLKLGIIYDGKGFNVEGGWKINFLKRGSYSISLNFLIPVNLKSLKLGKGLGFSGEGIYLNQNRYYWNINHFFDRKGSRDSWTYEGGITVPVTQSTYLSMGLGNSYWDSDPGFKLGIKVDWN